MLQTVHVLQQDLEAYLARLLPTKNDSGTEHHLGECKPCVARLTDWADFSATLREIRAGNREQCRYPRFATNGFGALQILNPFSSDYLEIHVSDVSKYGMRVHITTPVWSGSFVKVRVGKSLLFGKVRYCKPASDNFYYVGVQLHDFRASGSP